MKKTSKNPSAPIERIQADPSVGLTAEQVQFQAKKGLANVSDTKLEKSNLRIICESAFTFFNCVLYAIGIMFAAFMIFLAATGNDAVQKEYFGITKFIFLLSVTMNVVIGAVQGIRSKKTLQKLRIVTETKTTVIRDGEKLNIPGTGIVLDDILFVAAGDQLSADAIVLEGEVQVDESLLTGETDLIKKKAGDILYSGSFVIVGGCRARVEKVGDETYASTLSNKVKSLTSTKSELMVNIYRIINVMSILLFVIVGIVFGTLIYKTLRWGSPLADGDNLNNVSTWAKIFVTTASFAIGVIPTGLILITSVTLAVSIVTLSKQHTLVQELYSLENLSRVDVICLDKTGTLTDGTMKVVDVLYKIDEQEFAKQMSALLGCFEITNMTSAALERHFGRSQVEYRETIPFSSAKKCSGYVTKDGITYLMGAPDYIAKGYKEAKEYTEKQGKEGKRVIAFTKDGELLGLIALEDGIRASAKDTIAYFYENGVDVKIISGDNPITVSKIAGLCGVHNADKAISLEGVPLDKIPSLVTEYTIFARVSPEQKQALVEALQNLGRKVAMTGDGVNDILALRKANASITFNNATDAAKSCSNVVLLDNDFSHLKAVVGEGRRVVNNVERASVLFLMKSIAVAALAIALIPFKQGQAVYSLENVYLLETAIIGTGGFFLSLEPTKEPIRGSFGRNVLAKAIPSGLFVFIGAILPVLFSGFGLYNGDREVVTSLISMMTALAGATVLIAMCIPFNKHRILTISLVLGNILLFALALPSVFVGAKALHFANIETVLGEAFQPWKAAAIRAVFITADGAFNAPAFLTLALYFYIGLPLYYGIITLINKYLKERSLDDEDDLAKVVQRICTISGIVAFITAIAGIIVGALLLSGKIDLSEAIIAEAEEKAIAISGMIGSAFIYFGTFAALTVGKMVRSRKITPRRFKITLAVLFITFQWITAAVFIPYYITHRKNLRIAKFKEEAQQNA